MTRHGRAAAAAAAATATGRRVSLGQCMSDGWGLRVGATESGFKIQAGGLDDGWGVPPHRTTEQMRRLWAQNAGVERVGTSVWGRLVTTAQQAEWAFQAESRRMMLEGRGIWKPEHSKPLLELCAGQVFRSVPAHSCLFACTHICMYMYSLVRVPRRRDIFEDVYGPGVQRLCSAPCLWHRPDCQMLTSPCHTSPFLSQKRSQKLR
eukprot:SAG31_NODE_153_length_22196_cov_24.963570_10_plen_206_part_00